VILSLAVCMAPVLALVFGITAAPTVLGVGLLFTAWPCWSGPNHGGVVARSKLRIAGAVNLVMAFAVFLVVWVRLA
jgi:hypothetical protein